VEYQGEYMLAESHFYFNRAAELQFYGGASSSPAGLPCDFLPQLSDLVDIEQE
jgi:hypothetical protein